MLSAACGYTRLEVVGQSPRMLQGPATEQAALQHIHQGVKRGDHVIEVPPPPGTHATP